jgi:hypothetical protein
MPAKFFLYKYEEGDVVTFRKPHPCGSFEWKIISVGGEVKCKCAGCDRIVVFKRDTIEKSTKAVKKGKDKKAEE